MGTQANASRLGAALAAAALAAGPAAAAEVPYSVAGGAWALTTGRPGLASGPGVSTIAMPEASGPAGLVSQTDRTVGGALVDVLDTSYGSGIYQGTSAAAAAPVVPGGAAETQQYFRASGSGSFGYSYGVAFRFGADQQYLGLLWGSVGSSDFLRLYDNGVTVGTIRGADVLAAAGGVALSGQSFWVNINAAGTARFDTATIFTQGSRDSVEVSRVTYSAASQPIGAIVSPSEAPAPVIGGTPAGGALGLGLLGLGRHRRAAGRQRAA